MTDTNSVSARAPETDFLISDILDGTGDALETDQMPSSRAIRVDARRRFERIGQQQSLSDVIGAPPAVGEAIHIVSGAKFDFWTWTPVIVGWLGVTDQLFCSTWTASRGNVMELLALHDSGKIAPGQIHALAGTYFKRRETAVYSLLLDGIRQRGGRFRAFQNHAKVLLLANAAQGHFLTIEGSANFTSNPRLEQYVITNDKALHDWHKAWMEEVFAAPSVAAADRKFAGSNRGTL